MIDTIGFLLGIILGATIHYAVATYKMRKKMEQEYEECLREEIEDLKWTMRANSNWISQISDRQDKMGENVYRLSVAIDQIQKGEK